MLELQSKPWGGALNVLWVRGAYRWEAWRSEAKTLIDDYIGHTWMLLLLRLLCVSFSCAPHASCQQSSDTELSANAGYRHACGNCSCCFALCCRMKVKKKEKEKCEQFFHFFWPDSEQISAALPVLGSGRVSSSRPPWGHILRPKWKSRRQGSVLESWVFTRHKFGF